MRHIGVGLDRDEFTRGAREGTIGHVGLLETSAMVAHCLALELDELKQLKEPISSAGVRMSKYAEIPAGKVCGFKQRVVGSRGGREVLDFNMVGIVSPQPEDDVELGDYIRITGEPNVDIRTKEEIAQKGGLGTAAVTVNVIPRIIDAEPGFHAMNTIALPHYWSGSRAPDLMNARIFG